MSCNTVKLPGNLCTGLKTSALLLVPPCPGNRSAAKGTTVKVVGMVRIEQDAEAIGSQVLPATHYQL